MTAERINQLSEVEFCIRRYAKQFGLDPAACDLAVKLATGMLYRGIKDQPQSLRFGFGVVDRLREYHIEAGYV